MAAESYGGFYAPVLSKYIVDQNKAGAKPQINLQGTFVGNGIVSYALNDNSIVYLAYYHNLIGARAAAASSAASRASRVRRPQTTSCT